MPKFRLPFGSCIVTTSTLFLRPDICTFASNFTRFTITKGGIISPHYAILGIAVGRIRQSRQLRTSISQLRD
ncbi:MAG: hypothetical protein EZS28_004589 [Streblomastix strix]|uniref:Uncharacterized protein n=1 Tax=Streblomastix strix TaxID=222440 RepID=A0A5J4WYG7_9EUKA|nr:MAG: hypothetical protein EZS28_004589 [Streblomastix strix]